MLPFYNIPKQKTVKIKDVSKVQPITIILHLPDILSLSYPEYMAAVKCQIAAELANQNLSIDTPTLFTINCTTNDDLEFEDVDQLYICSAGALVDAITADAPRYDERRLTAKSEDINMTYSKLLAMVNSKTLVDTFNIIFNCQGYSLRMVG